MKTPEEEVVQGLVSLADEEGPDTCPKNKTIARLAAEVLKGESLELAIDHLASCRRCFDLYQLMRGRLRDIRSQMSFNTR